MSGRSRSESRKEAIEKKKENILLAVNHAVLLHLDPDQLLGLEIEKEDLLAPVHPDLVLAATLLLPVET